MPTPALRAGLTHRTPADIDWSQLPRVAPHPNATNHPEPADLVPFFDKVWLEHISGEIAGYQMCPTDHMPWYGGSHRALISSASLLATVNPDSPTVPDGPSASVPLSADFRAMIYGMLQVGIDTWGLMQDESHAFEAGGGLMGGRKFLVAFAGKMFGANAYDGPVYDMDGPWTMQRLVSGVMTSLPRFKEDQQFFEAPSTALAPVAVRVDWDWQGSPWMWGGDLGDRDYQHLPPATWSYDDAHYSEAYRICCSTPAFVGIALSMRMLDMEGVFANPAFFGGLDRYMILEHPSVYSQVWAVGVTPRNVDYMPVYDSMGVVIDYVPIQGTGAYHRAPEDYNPASTEDGLFVTDMWNAHRWHANQGQIRIVPDGFTFADSVDRGAGSPPPCPEARNPVMLTQMLVDVGAPASITPILVEIYASESYWLPPLLMIAGDYYPAGFSAQAVLGSPNDVVTYVDLANVVWLGSSTNGLGYFAEVVPIPSGIAGYELAMQALFVGATGCYSMTNALVVEVE
jgi:hypothetical protein